MTIMLMFVLGLDYQRENLMCKSTLISVCTKVASLCLMLITLSACELLPSLQEAELKAQNQQILCVNQDQVEAYAEFCQLDNWLLYMFKVQELTEPERTSLIQSLPDDNSSLIKKTLLSQSVETTYNKRLRAQNWIVKLSVGASDSMNFLLNKMIYANSQHLLEFESAITILSRVNARQQSEIDALQLQLQSRESEIKKQQEQVEQLLKIETDLLKQNRKQNINTLPQLDGQPQSNVNRSNER